MLSDWPLAWPLSVLILLQVLGSPWTLCLILGEFHDISMENEEASIGYANPPGKYNILTDFRWWKCMKYISPMIYFGIQYQSILVPFSPLVRRRENPVETSSKSIRFNYFLDLQLDSFHCASVISFIQNLCPTSSRREVYGLIINLATCFT